MLPRVHLAWRVAVALPAILVLVIVAWAGFSWYAAVRLTDVTHVTATYPDEYTGNPAGALGFRYQQVGVATPLGAMPAWYLPGTRHTWVILVHGLGGSRQDTLPAMPVLRALGLPMLAVTYRNDIGAPASEDHLDHLGQTEWRDVADAVDYARRHGASGVVLYGWSLGGTLSLLVARDPVESHFVRAIVLDSPLLDWKATLHWQVGRRGIPLPLAELAEKMVSWRVGLDYNRFRIGSLTAGITAPILLYQGSADTVVPPFLAARLAKTLSHQVTYIPVPGANHVASIDVDPVGYRLALDHFLSVEP